MHKLCTLKDLYPGSVIEVPKDYQSRAGETAVMLGLEYTSDAKNIVAEFVRPRGEEFITTAMPALDENTQVAVVEDENLKKASTNAFIAHKIALPELGMSMGCDPEIFVVQPDETVIPAWEFLPDERTAVEGMSEWKKANEVKIRSNSVLLPDTVPVYWDGAQAEFAPWAKGCLESLHNGTRFGLQSILQRARAKVPGAKLTLNNVIELPEQVRMNGANEHIQFRCSRSYNVYSDPGDGIPDAREYKYRCAGGHIHFGFTRNFTAPAIEQIIRGLDGILGVASVSLAAGIDNPERRHTYGRAGEFRLPSYGIEYRVLSNFWLSHPAIAMLVFELARAVVRLAESGLYNLCWAASEEETRQVINTCDVDGARKILIRNAPVLMGMLQGIWKPTRNLDEALIVKMREQAFHTLMKGIGYIVPKPSDIEGNWKLGKGIYDPFGYRGDNFDGWHDWCKGENESWTSLVKNTK